MSSGISSHAFILAAGRGTRLRPYTDHRPKPLVAVAGRSLIDHLIDKLIAAGIDHVHINLHHRGDQLRRHLEMREDVKLHFYEEDELLDTGGGIKQALPYMDGRTFIAMNGDAFLDDCAARSAMDALMKGWDPEHMDMRLLLEPCARMNLTGCVGDYALDEEGRARLCPDKDGDYMFTGIRLCDPCLFQDTPDGAFAFIDLMKRAEARGRLYGTINPGRWHHISRGRDYEAVLQAYGDSSKPDEVSSDPPTRPSPLERGEGKERGI